MQYRLPETESKLQELLQKIVKENEKEGLNIKKTESMVVSKRDSLTFKLQSGDTKIKQVNNLNMRQVF